MTALLDEIVHSTVIDAPVVRVWDLVSRPGWWICDGGLDLSTIDDRGDHAIVATVFRIERVAAEAPARAVFTWKWLQDPERPFTRVEFTLEALPDAGTRLTVRETGLSTGAGSSELLAEHYGENDEGWLEQLALARRWAEVDS